MYERCRQCGEMHSPMLQVFVAMVGNPEKVLCTNCDRINRQTEASARDAHRDQVYGDQHGAE